MSSIKDVHRTILTSTTLHSKFSRFSEPGDTSGFTYKPPSKNILDMASFCSFRICIRQTFEMGSVSNMISTMMFVTAAAKRAAGQLMQ